MLKLQPHRDSSLCKGQLVELPRKHCKPFLNIIFLLPTSYNKPYCI